MILIKRYILFITVVAFVVVLGCAEDLCAQGPMVYFGKNGRIIYISGTVDVLKKGRERWFPAKEDMLLQAGDKVRVQKRALVEIAFENLKNAVKLEGYTELTIGQIGPTKLELPNGRVFSLIEGLKEGSSFEVRTPSSTIGVKGTGWVTDTDGEKTTVLVFSDSVYIFSPTTRERRLIKRGWKTTVSRYTRLKEVELVVLTRLEKTRWNRWSREITERLEEKGRLERLRELDRRFQERFYGPTE